MASAALQKKSPSQLAATKENRDFEDGGRRTKPRACKRLCRCVPCRKARYTPTPHSKKSRLHTRQKNAAEPKNGALRCIVSRLSSRRIDGLVHHFTANCSKSQYCNLLYPIITSVILCIRVSVICVKTATSPSERLQRFCIAHSRSTAIMNSASGISRRRCLLRLRGFTRPQRIIFWDLAIRHRKSPACGRDVLFSSHSLKPHQKSPSGDDGLFLVVGESGFEPLKS